MNQFSRSLILVLLVAAPEVALAHTPIKGINNFYNGVLHPLLVPSHLLLLLATGLFLGQQGMKEKQIAIMTFLAATLLGLVGAWFSPGYPLQTVLLIGSAITGISIALAPSLPVFWCSVIAAASGLLLGFDSTQETLNGEARFVALFGSAVGIYFFSLYPIAFADYMRKIHWKQIIVRVTGSWLAASSFLVLALALK